MFDNKNIRSLCHHVRWIRCKHEDKREVLHERSSFEIMYETLKQKKEHHHTFWNFEFLFLLCFLFLFVYLYNPQP